MKNNGRNGRGRDRATMIVVRLGIGREFADRFQALGLGLVSNGCCEAKVAKRGVPALKEPGSWSLQEVRDNLDGNLGMNLAYLYLVERPSNEKHGKPSYFLVLKFRSDQRLEVDAELGGLVNQAFGRRYGKLACFQNPDGTFVVNATAPMSCDGRPMKLMILPNRRLAVYNETTHRPHTLDRVVL